MRTTAPVAIFVYNRADHTARTTKHLQRNLLATETDVYFFSDGGRDEASWRAVNKVRKLLHKVTGFRSVSVIERPCNYYLERNVIEGINQVLKTHDRIIVMEDDIVSSPYYLTYMNDALDYYRNDKQVMHVAGFTNLDIPEKGDTYFSPHVTSSGAWATWRDRWEKFVHYGSREEALAGLTDTDIARITYDGRFDCLKMLDRHPVPWDICWNIAVYRHGGLALHPTHTLVRNIGLSSGAHFTGLQNSRLFGWYEFDRPYSNHHVKIGGIPVAEDAEIERMYGYALTDHGMRYNALGRVARKFYKYLKESDEEYEEDEEKVEK